MSDYLFCIHVSKIPAIIMKDLHSHSFHTRFPINASIATKECFSLKTTFRTGLYKKYHDSFASQIIKVKFSPKDVVL